MIVVNATISVLGNSAADYEIFNVGSDNQSNVLTVAQN